MNDNQSVVKPSIRMALFRVLICLLLYSLHPSVFGFERYLGAYPVLYKGIRSGVIYGIGGLVASAVCRRDYLRLHSYQRVHNLRRSIVEERRPKMKAAYHGMNLINTCNCSGMIHGVHYSSMTAAREHYQSFILEVDDKPLIVVNLKDKGLA